MAAASNAGPDRGTDEAFKRELVKLIPHLRHQQTGHGDYEAAVFRQRNEAIRRYHALTGMLPAHQHLAATPVSIVPRHHGLQIGYEFPLGQRTLQFL